MKAPTSNRYFAAEPNAQDCAARCEEKFADWIKWNKDINRSFIIRKSAALVIGGTVNGTRSVSWETRPGGEQGEQIFSVENHYAGITDNLHNLTTAQRPSVECGAANGDYKSLAQTYLANDIAEYYLKERALEAKLKEAASLAFQQHEGLVLVEWDAQAGEELGPNPQHFQEFQQGERAAEDVGKVYAGDVKATVLGPLDVARDPYVTGFDELRWVITQTWEDKYELAARYPEKSADILALSVEKETLQDRRIDLGRQSLYQSDLLPVYTLFHRNTPALKQGRVLRYLTNGVVLLDAPNPYRWGLPVYAMFPRKLGRTSCGFSPLTHLMGPQDVVNAIDSSVVTNALGRGIGNMLTPRAANVTVDKLGTSMNNIEYDGDRKPEPLEWPAAPPELYALKREKVEAMEVLSGINSVVRGNPSEAVGADSSGAKLALIEAQAIRNNSDAEKSWADLVRDVVQGHIRCLRDFGGDVRRIAKLAGKNGQYLVREFVAQDLQDIDRVKVDIGNPMMRTVAGKMAIADKLREVAAEAGKPLQPERYFEIVTAGTFKPLIEDQQSTQMRITSENERLMEGQSHQVLISDPHWLDIPRHLAILDNPALRDATPENEAIQQATLAVVQQHLEFFRAMPPDLVAMRGGVEALAMWQQVQQASGAMAATVQAQDTAAPGPPAAEAEAAEEVTNPDASRPDMPGMPSLPESPSLVDGAPVQ